MGFIPGILKAGLRPHLHTSPTKKNTFLKPSQAFFEPILRYFHTSPSPNRRIKKNSLGQFSLSPGILLQAKKLQF